MSDQGPIRVAVVGVGSFGKNHARVYHELQKQGAGVELVAVVDSDAGLAQAVSDQFGCRALSNLSELQGQVDAATGSLPTVHHLDIPTHLIAAGVDSLAQ